QNDYRPGFASPGLCELLPECLISRPMLMAPPRFIEFPASRGRPCGKRERGYQMRFPSGLRKMTRRHEGIAAIVALAKDRQTKTGPRKKLPHGAGHLSPGFFHQSLRGYSFRKCTLLEGFHLSAGQDHGWNLRQ